LGEKIHRRIIDHLGIQVNKVRTVDVYTIDAHLKHPALYKIASGPFSDPVIQRFTIDRPLADKFDWLIEVGFKPGVTDNVGKTAAEAAGLCLADRRHNTFGVYTSRQYVITGKICAQEAETIASRLLANELIERYRIYDGRDWQAQGSVEPYLPKVTGLSRPKIVKISLSVTDEVLLKISKERLLALNLCEMQTIQGYLCSSSVVHERKAVGLGKMITDVELECLAQTWSEHCKHKIFNSLIHYEDEKGRTQIIHSLFDTYIKGSTYDIRKSMGDDDWCLSVFSDNAGIIKFNKTHNMVFKVETHNSPSALDPYGGALTGIVGVNRDPFGTGKGAKLIFNTDVFCFAPPDYEKPLPERILHPRRIYEGVREGVEHGGNKSGIPTVNGCIVFDERYLGKPLVYCGTGGIMPAEIAGAATHNKVIIPGDIIVMTGGRIGKDGIHGATFSSEELHEGSPVTAVQIGDPITQKKMTDFLLKARDRDLYRAITDNGAGGLSSSIGEMARLCGGCFLDLKKAPLKYAGLQPWEILLSEAQERMSLAVYPHKIDEFLLLAEKMGVEATVLGRFTDSGKFHVLYGERTVAYLDMDFLHNGLPPMQLTAKWMPPVYDEPHIPEPPDMRKALLAMLSRFNICSKESVVRQYDHEVQGGSVVKPLVGAHDDGPGDAAVILPLLDSFEGIVVANGICPRYSDIDTYHMTACAVDEAVRNAVAVGGSLDHLAGLDNFCWCDPVESETNPDGRYKLAQLVRANMALYDYTKAYGVPCISGKDSMKNDYRIGNTKISIPPTLLFSVIGKIPDIRKCVTMDAKAAGDLIYVLGLTREELGGSEWFAMQGHVGNQCPKVDADKAKRLYQSLGNAMQQGYIRSCHDCSDGGLAIALAETAFAGGFGIHVRLDLVPYAGVARNDYILFSETQSRFIVTILPDAATAFERIMAGNTLAKIGMVTREKDFLIKGLNGNDLISENIEVLKAAWQKPLKDI
jgi:phosphoribosylformylglycinamidine synthase